MSVVYGIANTSESHFYQSWFNESEADKPLSLSYYETEYQRFTRNEWEDLGYGEELYWALSIAISEQDNFGKDDPVQNYRIKGQGDMLNFRIHSNP